MRKYKKYLDDSLYIIGADKLKIYLLFLVYFITPFLDVIGIGLLGPYIALIANPDAFYQNQYFQNVIFFFNLDINHNSKILLYSSLFLIFIFTLKFIFMILSNYMQTSISMYYMIAVRKKLLQAYKIISYEEYISNNSSKYIETVTGLVTLFVTKCLLSYLRLFGLFIIIFFLTILLVITNWKLLTIVVFLLLPVALAYDFFFRKSLISLGKKKSKSKEQMIVGVNEFFEGFKQNLIFDVFKFFEDKVIKGSQSLSASEVKTQFITGSPKNVIELIFVIFFVLYILILTSFDSFNFLESLPMFTVFFLSFVRIVPSFSELVLRFQNIAESEYATEVIYNEIKKYNDHKKIDDQINKSNEAIKTFESFELKNISYTYPNNSNLILDNISLKFYKNETIGIIGPSGSGKTTLVDLILGLLTPSNGKVFINDLDINKFGLNNWHKNVAYLPQEVFLVDEVIEKNITLKNENLGKDEKNIKLKNINDAIERSNLKKFVNNLPLGSNTQIGERGVRLSGGQKQRLIFARAFYHKRNFFILDESTSSLDHATEKEIINEIVKIKGKVTIIIIAHRMSTIKHCDRIYKVDNGKITASGKYSEIVKDEE
jgi:ABC-type multidrug transport system fused ATPase/permease subunit